MYSVTTCQSSAVKPVRSHPLRAIRQLIALANCVRSLVANAIEVVAGVGVNYRLLFDGARKAIEVRVPAGNN
jgi:hypothetical protein